MTSLPENEAITLQSCGDASGVKHRVIHSSMKPDVSPTGRLTTADTTDYVGKRVYLNGKLDKILTPYGYLQGGKFHTWLHDYQGNIVAVVVGGSVAQRNSYYPYGLPHVTGLIKLQSPSATSVTVNPYKYGGKEYDTFGGADLYDFHARYHAPSTGRYGLVDEDGNEYKGNDKFAKAVVNALRMLQKGDNGNRLVLAAIESTNQMRISEVNETHPDNLFQEHKNGDITIWWNPNKKAAGYSEFWRGDGTSISMSFVGLGHEMAHGIDFWYGDYDNNIWLDYGVSGKVYCADIFACHYENLIRAEHSLPIRTHYARYSNGNPIENSRIAYRMGLLPQSFINIHPLKKLHYETFDTCHSCLYVVSDKLGSAESTRDSN